MIVLVQRPARPDMPYWPGRRLLAAADAVAWPMGWVALVHQIPNAGQGVLLVTFVAALFASFRLWQAIGNNHRYRFTTWWVLRCVALLSLAVLLVQAVRLVAPLLQ